MQKYMALIGALSVLLGVIGLANAQQKPNIIYLMADDQNVGSVGCYGNPEVETPNMEPTADLFHLSKDPLEMKNLAGNLEAAFMLYTMRGKYDEELLRWKSEAVPFNRYPQYGKIFDRSIPWDQKTVDNLVHGAAQPNKQKKKSK